MSWLFPVIAVLAGALIGAAIVACILPRALGRHEAMRWYLLVVNGLALLPLAAVVIEPSILGSAGAATSMVRGTAGLFLLLVVVGLLAQLFRAPTDREFRANFAHAPTRCGRCGYNLHGSESPTCPECGWAIPQTLTGLERRDWALWWKRWEIAHLDRPRYTLINLVVICLMFLATAAFFTLATPGPNAAVIVLFPLLLAHFVVNIVRVAQYIRRSR